ncbi:MAG: CPBP family intramembrane metalloprotease [Bacteroidales bacterium]|nr:CPBP family intramembrane metalloprotease [Bacteroidales bacterium]
MIKKIFRTIGAVALLLVMYALFQGLFTVLAVAVAIAIAIAKGKLPADSLGLISDTSLLDPSSAVGGYVVNAMACGLFVSALAMLLFIHFTGFFKLRLSIFRSISIKPLLIATALVFTSMFALNIFVNWFPLENNLEVQFDGLAHNILGAFTISVLAPVLEEVMFRGAIQGYIARTFGKPWLAILVAALIFGIYHWNPVQVVYATLLGIIFGWIYYITGSLLSVIVGHVLNNSIATFTMLFMSDISEVEVSNSSPGYISFVLFAALSVWLAVILYRSMAKKQS